MWFIIVTGLVFYWSNIGNSLNAPTVHWSTGGCDGGCDSGWLAPPLYYSLNSEENIVVSCARSVRAIFASNGSTYWQHKGVNELYYGCNYVDDIGLVTMNKVSYIDINLVWIYNKYGEVVNILNKTEACCEWRSLTLGQINPNLPDDWYIIVGRTKSDYNVFVYDTSFNLQKGWPQLNYSYNAGNSWGLYADNIGLLDLNGDGVDDLVVPQDVPQIAAYFFDGTPVNASSKYGTGQDSEVWAQVGSWWDERWNINSGGPCDLSQTNGGYRGYYTTSGASSFQLNTAQYPEHSIIVTIPRIDECDNNNYGSYTSIGYTVYVYNTDHSRFEGDIEGFGYVNWTEPPYWINPKLTPTVDTVFTPYPHPVIVDLDLDGYPEILFSGWDGKIHCFPFLLNDNKDECFNGNFPYNLNDMNDLINTNLNPSGYVKQGTEPVVVDIDNDGLPEIIIATYYEETGDAPFGEIIILSNTGQLLNYTSFPSTTRSKHGTWPAPTIGNIDKSDNNLELVVQSIGSGTIMFKFGDYSNEFQLIWPTSRGNFKRDGRGVQFTFDGVNKMDTTTTEQPLTTNRDATSTTTNSYINTTTTTPPVDCTAECRQCKDGSCQEKDDDCNYIPCADHANGYIITFIVVLDVLVMFFVL